MSLPDLTEEHYRVLHHALDPRKLVGIGQIKRTSCLPHILDPLLAQGYIYEDFAIRNSESRLFHEGHIASAVARAQMLLPTHWDGALVQLQEAKSIQDQLTERAYWCTEKARQWVQNAGHYPPTKGDDHE
jgi:hypothetical protein